MVCVWELVYASLYRGRVGSEKIMLCERSRRKTFPSTQHPRFLAPPTTAESSYSHMENVQWTRMYYFHIENRKKTREKEQGSAFIQTWYVTLFAPEAAEYEIFPKPAMQIIAKYSIERLDRLEDP